MLYKSTRGTDKNLTFQDTVLMGLARDGGLILPEIVPSVASRLDTLKSLSYQELAFEIIRLFATDIPDNDLRQIINKSYSTFRDREITPVKSFENLHILELFPLFYAKSMLFVGDHKRRIMVFHRILNQGMSSD